MVDWMYQLLGNLGYTHPVHPALVHVPIGNVVAAFVFGIIGLVFRKQSVGRAGYYALVLAFISLFPGVFSAVADWLRYFAGVWLFPIKMKVILASVLIVILGIEIIMGRKDAGATVRGVTMSFLAVLAVTGLGYFGANLVYSGIPEAPSKRLEEGRRLFAVDCRFCHPQGGNIIRPQFPLLGSPQLSDSGTFIEYIRNPLLPNGERGSMPRFAPTKISDKQAEALYDYITEVLEKGVAPGIRRPMPAYGPGATGNK